MTTAVESCSHGDVVHISETPPHSCAVCESPQYKQAEEIIKRSGLSPDYWGYLLHDIARALITSRGLNSNGNS